MAHNPKGFTGTVDQVAEARRFAAAAPLFRVSTSTDWVPTVVAGVDRTISISTGIGQVTGVNDPTDAAETVQFAANNSASTRYDVLVARWNWATLSVTFVAVQGTTVQPTINATGTPDPAKINRLVGAMYDGVIGLVQVRPSVGVFLSTDIVADLRVWGGITGRLVTAQAAHLDLIDGLADYELTTIDRVLNYRHDGTAWQAVGSDSVSGRTVAYGSMTGTQQATATVTRVLGGLNVNPILTPGRLYEVGWIGTGNAEASYTVRVMAGASAPTNATGTLVAGANTHTPNGVTNYGPLSFVSAGQFTVGTTGPYYISPFLSGNTNTTLGPGSAPRMTLVIRDAGPLAGISGSTPIAVP